MTTGKPSNFRRVCVLASHNDCFYQSPCEREVNIDIVNRWSTVIVIVCEKLSHVITRVSALLSGEQPHDS